jgi:hypothetical protein
VLYTDSPQRPSRRQMYHTLLRPQSLTRLETDRRCLKNTSYRNSRSATQVGQCYARKTDMRCPGSFVSPAQDPSVRYVERYLQIETCFGYYSRSQGCAAANSYHFSSRSSTTSTDLPEEKHSQHLAYETLSPCSERPLQYQLLYNECAVLENGILRTWEQRFILREHARIPPFSALNI